MNALAHQITDAMPAKYRLTKFEKLVVEQRKALEEKKTAKATLSTKLEEQLSSLINTSKYDLSSSWPLGESSLLIIQLCQTNKFSGSVKNFKSWDRFDMGIFHHFNQTHHFFADDYDSADKLSERDSEEIGTLLNLCNLQPSILQGVF